MLIGLSGFRTYLAPPQSAGLNYVAMRGCGKSSLRNPRVFTRSVFRRLRDDPGDSARRIVIGVVESQAVASGCVVVRGASKLGVPTV